MANGGAVLGRSSVVLSSALMVLVFSACCATSPLPHEARFPDPRFHELLARIERCESVRMPPTLSNEELESSLGWNEVDVEFYEAYFAPSDGLEVVDWKEARPSSWTELEGWLHEARKRGVDVRSVAFDQRDDELRPSPFGEDSREFVRLMKEGMSLESANRIRDEVREILKQYIPSHEAMVGHLRKGRMENARQVLRNSGSAEDIVEFLSHAGGLYFRFRP
jgi:hypothetical protein